MRKQNIVWIITIVAILLTAFTACSGNEDNASDTEFTRPETGGFDSLAEAYASDTDTIPAGQHAYGIVRFVTDDGRVLILDEIGLDWAYSGTTSQTPNDFYTFIKFSSNNRIEMWDENFPERSRRNSRTGIYTIHKRNGLGFITISWSGGASEEYLFILNNFWHELYLYTSNGAPFFKPSSDELRMRIYGDDSWISASSSFSETIGERVTAYTPAKLGNRIGECWVPVNELHERLTLTINLRFEMPKYQNSFPIMYYDLLFFSSGFVSFTSPNLYTDNSRIKKIRISDNSGNSRIIELFDTPHFQPISVADIGGLSEEKHVLTIEILEVFPGSRFRHTCVNALFWVKQIVVPQ